MPTALKWPLALLVLVLAGCATQPHPRMDAVAADISVEELLSGAALGIDPAVFADSELLIEADQILAVDDDMRAFVASYVDPGSSAYLRLQQLLRAIITDETFGLTYDETTQTASATFHARAGNCLSFTNMFIAMAREANLEVSYQEVDIPPDWSMRGDTYLLSRHVNVHVDLGPEREHVVDFNIDDFKATYDRRDISDERAYAHFFSNKGVERLQAGDTTGAFLLFRAALEFDAGFAAGWSNLGTLYGRVGEVAYAEAAYLQALRLQPDELLPMSNLARLYGTQGNEELASYYRDRVAYHRDRNPYYRYQLARQAFLERDYEAAIENLEYAVRQKQWEDSFYFLMGLSYLQLGDERQARRWLQKAESVADSDSLKRNYQSKIDLLLSSNPTD